MHSFIVAVVRNVNCTTPPFVIHEQTRCLRHLSLVVTVVNYFPSTRHHTSTLPMLGSSRDSSADDVSLPLTRSSPPLWLGGGAAMYARRRTKQRTVCVFVVWPLVALFVVVSIVSPAREAVISTASKVPLPFFRTSSLVFSPSDMRRLWAYEIAIGHYPSLHRLPSTVAPVHVRNPTIPPFGSTPGALGQTNEEKALHDGVMPTGPPRVYLDLVDRNVTSHSYPPRPLPGSILDMDQVMRFCDFSSRHYARDCLKMLRLGGHLDPGNQVQQRTLLNWRHLYLDNVTHNFSLPNLDPKARSLMTRLEPLDLMDELKSHRYAEILDQLEKIGLHKPADPIQRPPHPTHPDADPICDPDYPRLFHMFWTGPFTDKPYAAIASFLFTQNLGLHLPLNHQAGDSRVREKQNEMSQYCRPQMWIWINPGPAAAVPNEEAELELLEELKANPWSAPFLHARFQQVVRFKMWNTTEQLDDIVELKHHWRNFTLLNSAGHKYGSQPKPLAEADVVDNRITDDVVLGEDGKVNEDGGVAKLQGFADETPSSDDIATPRANAKLKKRGIDAQVMQRVGSKSESTYDRPSVVLSDAARFILCHRFGGIYLDVDTLLLRDWEEMWGWKGQFAYRWSRLPLYNTAVLKLHRRSALGSFIFKTALARGLDFHPMSISQYTKDANVEGLLLRLPDALFDSAWLNVEKYQRDKPTFPKFEKFEHFFQIPTTSEHEGEAEMFGFNGFFRGAFSYHYHNFWWRPFDPLRNWPDLGRRFEKTEVVAKSEALGLKLKSDEDAVEIFKKYEVVEIEKESGDKRILELSWASVLKRTFEAYLRGERPNMYGEWLDWEWVQS